MTSRAFPGRNPILGRAEVCFRLQTQNLPFGILIPHCGREGEVRASAEPCAPESTSTFRVGPYSG